LEDIVVTIVEEDPIAADESEVRFLGFLLAEDRIVFFVRWVDCAGDLWLAGASFRDEIFYLWVACDITSASTLTSCVVSLELWNIRWAWDVFEWAFAFASLKVELLEVRRW